MARVIGEVQPRYVLVENSPLLVSRGLDVVLADLAALGFDARWGVVGADRTGAFHRRERLWILANTNGKPVSDVLDSSGEKRRGEDSSPWPVDAVDFDFGHGVGVKRVPVAQMGRMVQRVANRVDRLKAIGNGQVPQCAALAWRILSGLD